MAKVSKKEADAHDRIIEAASKLFDLIESSRIEIDEYDLEELTIYLAKHAVLVKEILNPLLRVRTHGISTRS